MRTGATVTLADGRAIRVSADDNPELLWLLRGGAGRFGVVSEFEFQLHSLQAVLADVSVYRAADAGAVLRAFRNFAEAAPDEFCGRVEIGHHPPLPREDGRWQGKAVVTLVTCWCGAASAGVEQLAPLSNIAPTLARWRALMPYYKWQRMSDHSAPHGRFNYWKNATFAALDDSIIDLLEGLVLGLPDRASKVQVQHMGGAVERVPESRSAFVGRNANFFVNLIGTVTERAAFEALCDWVQRVHGQLMRTALPGAIANFDEPEEPAAVHLNVRRAQRLAQLRRACDPSGMFLA